MFAYDVGYYTEHACLKCSIVVSKVEAISAAGNAQHAQRRQAHAAQRPVQARCRDGLRVTKESGRVERRNGRVKTATDEYRGRNGHAPCVAPRLQRRSMTIQLSFVNNNKN